MGEVFYVLCSERNVCLPVSVVIKAIKIAALSAVWIWTDTWCYLDTVHDHDHLTLSAPLSIAR